MRFARMQAHLFLCAFIPFVRGAYGKAGPRLPVKDRTIEDYGWAVTVKPGIICSCKWMS